MVGKVGDDIGYPKSNQIEGQLTVHPPDKVAKSASGFEGLFFIVGTIGSYGH